MGGILMRFGMGGILMRFGMGGSVMRKCDEVWGA